MIVRVVLESETKNFWTFKEIGLNTKPYDVPKTQIADAFQHLQRWQEEPKASNFSTKLYELMAKADSENFRKIFNGFPARATAYSLWYYTTNKTQLQKYIEGIDNRTEL